MAYLRDVEWRESTVPDAPSGIRPRARRSWTMNGIPFHIARKASPIEGCFASPLWRTWPSDHGKVHATGLSQICNGVRISVAADRDRHGPWSTCSLWGGSFVAVYSASPGPSSRREKPCRRWRLSSDHIPLVTSVSVQHFGGAGVDKRRVTIYRLFAGAHRGPASISLCSAESYSIPKSSASSSSCCFAKFSARTFQSLQARHSPVAPREEDHEHWCRPPYENRRPSPRGWRLKRRQKQRGFHSHIKRLAPVNPLCAPLDPVRVELRHLFLRQKRRRARPEWL